MLLYNLSSFSLSLSLFPPFLFFSFSSPSPSSLSLLSSYLSHSPSLSRATKYPAVHITFWSWLEYEWGVAVMIAFGRVNAGRDFCAVTAHVHAGTRKRPRGTGAASGRMRFSMGKVSHLSSFRPRGQRSWLKQVGTLTHWSNSAVRLETHEKIAMKISTRNLVKTLCGGSWRIWLRTRYQESKR